MNSTFISGCDDLTGNWVGTCQNQDGKIEEDKILIEQDDCSMITINNISLNVGGETTLGSRFAAGTSDILIYSDWDFAKKVLDIRNEWRVRSFNEQTFLFEVSRETIERKGDSLLKTQIGKKTIEASGAGGTTSFSSACTYTKS